MGKWIVYGNDLVFQSYFIEKHGEGKKIEEISGESNLELIDTLLSSNGLFDLPKLLLIKGLIKERRILERLRDFQGDVIMLLERKPLKEVTEITGSSFKVVKFSEGEDLAGKVKFLLQWYKVSCGKDVELFLNKEFGGDIGLIRSLIFLSKSNLEGGLSLEFCKWYLSLNSLEVSPWDVWSSLNRGDREEAFRLAEGVDPLALLGYIGYLAKKDRGLGYGRYCEGRVWEELIKLDRLAKIYKDRANALIIGSFVKLY
jgi:hypothetical protein